MSLNFITMDFSLLSPLEFFVDPKMEMGETINHPLCGQCRQLKEYLLKKLYANKVIGFIVTNNRITNRTADFFNSPIAFWLCFYLNTAFHMAVISPTCMFSVSTKLLSGRIMGHVLEASSTIRHIIS